MQPHGCPACQSFPTSVDWCRPQACNVEQAVQHIANKLHTLGRHKHIKLYFPHQRYLQRQLKSTVPSLHWLQCNSALCMMKCLGVLLASQAFLIVLEQPGVCCIMTPYVARPSTHCGTTVSFNDGLQRSLICQIRCDILWAVYKLIQVSYVDT